MRFLVGTHAYNAQIQNTALALLEGDMLGEAYLGLVDNYRSAQAKMLRRVIQLSSPYLDHQLRRRHIANLPDSLIVKHWKWELLRTLGVKSGLGECAADQLWELGEHALDKKCAIALERSCFDGYLGVEHGALLSIRKTKELGKKSVVSFLSPHHSLRKKWVDPEYEKWPQLLSPSAKRLQQIAPLRDERRNQEAQLADVVFANSRLTRDSLIDAGIPKQKIITVPLGSATSSGPISLPDALNGPLKFIYAGTLSVHKGSHYLLQGWQRFRENRAVELHLFGTNKLPPEFQQALSGNVVCHGPVSRQELFQAFQKGAALIFPTLCDGWGLVVTEALANGLPVISTRNAGAADRISEDWNGFFVPAADSAAISDRIEWCLDHRERLVEMRSNAIASASEWTWADFRESLRQQLSERFAANGNGG